MMRKCFDVVKLLLTFLVFQALGALTMPEAMAIKTKFWFENRFRVKKPEDIRSVRNQPAACEDGVALIDNVEYPCDDVDFLSLVGRGEIFREREEFTDTLFEMSDVWGWLSPEGREITLACMTNSLWFIDGTDPVNPISIGYIESHRPESFWCDVKVYKDVAYIVQDRDQSDNGGNNLGMQVFNLLRLAELNGEDLPVKLDPDFTYAEHGAAHNVLIDNDSGFLFNVGASGGNDCQGGLHMVDLADPLEPVLAGCAEEDEYVHDAQCVVYTGPDTEYFAQEICFGYNEDTITIYDVTDKQNPVILSRTTYETATYTHQGWLNKDQDFLVMNDELDEQQGAVGNTRSYIINITSLEAPIFTGFFDHPVAATDHNMYFWGEIHARGWGGNPPLIDPPNRDLVYCANYAAGLRVLDASGIKATPPQIKQIGFFDVSPDMEGNDFFGAWSSYMHPSGVIAVTAIETGVFFLDFTLAFSDEGTIFNDTLSPTASPTSSPIPDNVPPPDDTVESTGVGGLPGGFVVLYLCVVFLTCGAVLFNIKIFNQQVIATHISQEVNLNDVEKINTRSMEVEVSHVNPMFEAEKEV